MATVENPALTAELQRLAGQHVQILRGALPELNYSEQTIQSLDEFLAALRGSVPDGEVIGYGAYVGETIRRNLGGVWILDERGVALLNDVGNPGISASPFSWVQKRIANGMEDSLAYKYSFLSGEVSKARAITPPASSGLRVAGQKPPLAPTAGADDARTLARAPLLVFLLVAAADGKLDKKEFRKFSEILQQSSTCPSPRLRQAIVEMAPNLPNYYEEITGENFDPVAELQRVAQIMDTQYASEALAFKESLLSLAIRIAEASGGFLGFGSKIDKNEKEAIAFVAVTLGLAG